jgi:hypothetical protein
MLTFGESVPGKIHPVINYDHIPGFNSSGVHRFDIDDIPQLFNVTDRVVNVYAPATVDVEDLGGPPGGGIGPPSIITILLAHLFPVFIINKGAEPVYHKVSRN